MSNPRLLEGVTAPCQHFESSHHLTTICPWSLAILHKEPHSSLSATVFIQKHIHFTYMIFFSDQLKTERKTSSSGFYEVFQFFVLSWENRAIAKQPWIRHKIVEGPK